MGTRALVHVHKADKDSVIIATIYRQFDGYLDGLGQDIKDAGCFKICNGIRDEVAGQAANGMGCYAAQLIASLKDGSIGNVYLYPPGSKDVWEEFTYHLWCVGEVLHMSIEGYPYEGPLSEINFEALETANED
jgi:hypothetical protein